MPTKKSKTEIQLFRLHYTGSIYVRHDLRESERDITRVRYLPWMMRTVSVVPERSATCQVGPAYNAHAGSSVGVAGKLHYHDAIRDVPSGRGTSGISLI